MEMLPIHLYYVVTVSSLTIRSSTSRQLQFYLIILDIWASYLYSD